MSGMSGYLDGLNFDSDEDFEETVGRGRERDGVARGAGGPAVRQEGISHGRGRGGGVGRGGDLAGGVIEGFSQVAGPARGRGGGQPGRGGIGVGGQVRGAQGDLGDQRASPTSRDLSGPGWNCLNISGNNIKSWLPTNKKFHLC